MDAAPNADALSPEESGETIEVVDPSRAEARIGRYQLCYHLASGGMASVFLARAVGPAGFWKPVALKRIHPHLARRKDFVAMFLDEARIAARIDHPNVCAVHDFGEADGTYYLAMEYLVGVPLIRLLHAMEREAKAGRSRFESTRWHALAARVIADAAAGLHAAHELSEGGEPLGVVHRDVSPQNVFVTFAGAVKVVDFGIALARDRVQETETGTLKGKLGYMAPEQAASGALDRRADVWALGVCLWEMLVGARLFRRGTPMETLRAVADAPIEAPSSRRAGVPAELDRIVLRALSRDREGRQPTARALARELEAFVRATGEPTGLSDLAEWMDPLFTAERAQKSEIVHTVLHAADVSTAMRAKRTGEVLEGQVRRVGDGAYRSVDARVIATTRASLEERVNAGAFREDLLHRLSVFDLRVPPLRERGRDGLAIAREVAEQTGPRDVDAVEREVGGRAGYQWPGNVRELRSFVRRVIALGGGEIGAPPLGAELPVVRLDLPFHDAKKRWVDTFERQYLTTLLDECAGNVSEAARRSGLSRAHLHEILERHHLR